MEIKYSKNQGITFKDVSINVRKKALNGEMAQQLLADLPPQIKDKLIISFLDHTTPVSNDIIEYFTDNSEISCSVKKDPGSAMPFENLYLKRATNPIDQYFLKCRAGDQIHQRLHALQEHLPRILNQEFNGNSLKLDNIGSGPGRDMINVLQNNDDLAKKMHVRNIDPDSESLGIGQSLVKELNLASSFSFIPKQINDVPPRDADILLLIGIFCPMKSRVCKVVLKGLESFVGKGGIIIFSTAQKRMLMDDPLTDFIMSFHGWRMDYKTDQEAAEISVSCGWKVLTQFFDEPYRHHCMTVAKYENKKINEQREITTTFSNSLRKSL